MNVAQSVERWARERGQETALIVEGRTTTFAELDRSVNRVANGLADLGINRGDRVAIMLPNSPEFIETFYACQKLGAVAVPFNTMYKGREIQHILKDSGARAIVCQTNFVPLINELLPELPDLEHIVTTGERTLTLADPEATLFVQAVLSKSHFADLDRAYRAVGAMLVDCFHSLGAGGAWYKHRGSIRVADGRKMAAFYLSEIEDQYVLNTLCFVKPFAADDFFSAVWVPPEVRDKIVEPLSALSEQVGRDVEDGEFVPALRASAEKAFGVRLTDGELTREEQFGYVKQRSMAAKAAARKAEAGAAKAQPSGPSALTRLKGMLFGRK